MSALLEINGVEIRPANIDEKTRARLMFLLRSSHRRTQTIRTYTDMLLSAISRRNWDEVEKIAAKISEEFKER